MSDSTAQTPTPQITEEMIEAGAMTLDERIPWDQHTPTGRAFMRLQAAAVLKAALAGRTVVETGSVASMVREFHEAFDLPIGDTTRTHNELRAELIREEAKETADAVEFEPLPQIAKELADLVIVTYGAALTMGIDLDRAVALVHASNMSKLGDDGRPVMRGDGKVLKGPNYRAPDMSTALASESSGDSDYPRFYRWGDSHFYRVDAPDRVRFRTDERNDWSASGVRTEAELLGASTATFERYHPEQS